MPENMKRLGGSTPLQNIIQRFEPFADFLVIQGILMLLAGAVIRFHGLTFPQS